MRPLGFDTVFHTARSDQVQIVLHLAPDETGRELLEDELLGPSQANLVNSIALAKGVDAGFAIGPSDGNTVVLQATSAALSEPWHIAALLNTFEGASFLMDEEEKPWPRVSVYTPQPLTLTAVYEDLDRHLTEVRQIMLELLQDGFDGAELTDGLWPEQPVDFLFDLVVTFTAPLPRDAQSAFGAQLEALDQLLAESAFSPDADCDVWMEDGLIPYPVEFTVTETELRYSIEMPPSDFAVGLLLALQGLEQMTGVTVASAELTLREGF